MKMFTPDFQEKLQPMEKKKLLRLDKECDAFWNEAYKLESERNKLLSELKPKNQERLDILKGKRDVEKEEIKEKMRELKEERKVINEKFKDNSKWIREERKRNIDEDENLAYNKLSKKKAWDNSHKKRSEWNKYYNQLSKKYRNENKGVKE